MLPPPLKNREKASLIDFRSFIYLNDDYSTGNILGTGTGTETGTGTGIGERCIEVLLGCAFPFITNIFQLAST